MNIFAELNHQKILTLTNNIDAYLFQGENLSTILTITMPSTFNVYDFYLEFYCPDESVYSTEKLTVESTDRIYYPLPYDILAKRGRLKFQLVARAQDDFIFKSSIAYIDIKDSINADQVLVEEFEDVITKCISKADYASIEADRCNAATNETLAVKNDIREALDIANQTQQNLDSAINEANLSRQQSILATNDANQAVIECEQVITKANKVIDSSNAVVDIAQENISMINTLYNDIHTRLLNGDLDGKDAYSYAQDMGYQGSREEFGQHLANIDKSAERKYLDDNFANAVTGSFYGKRAELDNCQDNKTLIEFMVHPSKTIPQLPLEYVSQYTLPHDKELKIDITDSDNRIISKIECQMPYPLYSIEGAKDIIEWDESLQRYCIVYRTRCMELKDLEWVYQERSDLDRHASFIAFDVPSLADTQSPYYECASIPNYYDERLAYSDFSGIALLSVSGSFYIRLRVSRELLDDNLEINNLIAQEGHKIIYSLKEEERIPLSQDISERIRDIMTKYPKSYIDVYTNDNQYIALGRYHLDTKSYSDTKAGLIGNNIFRGDQLIEGDIEHMGNYHTQSDYITLRHNQKDTGSLAEYAGIKIDGMNSNKQGIIRMNREGKLFIGLEDRVYKVATSLSSTEWDGALAFWDEEYGSLRYFKNYSINTFLQQTISDIILLSVDQWEQDDDRYIYTLENSKIKEDSLVMVSYEDDAKPIASLSGIANYNPIVGDGSLILKADSIPTSDINIRLIIMGVANGNRY